MWGGLIISDLVPSLPPSSAVIAVASAIYAVAFLSTHERLRLRLGAEN